MLKTLLYEIWTTSQEIMREYDLIKAWLLHDKLRIDERRIHM